MDTPQPKDLSHHFEGSDIGIAITAWRQENKDYWIFFIPLELHNAPQDALQKIGNEVTRLHFTLLEMNEKLHFVDIVEKQGWILDTSEVCQGRLRLVGDRGAVVFVRESVVDLGVLVDRE